MFFFSSRSSRNKKPMPRKIRKKKAAAAPLPVTLVLPKRRCVLPLRAYRSEGAASTARSPPTPPRATLASNVQLSTRVPEQSLVSTIAPPKEGLAPETADCPDSPAGQAVTCTIRGLRHQRSTTSLTWRPLRCDCDRPVHLLPSTDTLRRPWRDV